MASTPSRSRKPSKPKSEYAIQTVANAFRMLEVFRDESEMGVSDLARQLGLHKNNAFRLLATLELSGYVEQCAETEVYRLGPRCLELGRAFARTHSLTQQARPVLQALAADFGETAHLGTLSGMEVAHIDAALPNQVLLTASRVGDRLPAYCTALGKVLLSGELESSPAPQELSDVLVGSTKLEARTDTTIVDPTKLLEALRAAQMEGYATDLGEYANGLACVAAPVFDLEGQLVAALSLSGPASRLDADRVHGEAKEAIVAAAKRLSLLMGAVDLDAESLASGTL